MKYLIIFLFLSFHILYGNSSAEAKNSHLIDCLSDAYTLNNSLIHKQIPKKDINAINLLTDNYINQLQYIKILSDNQLQKKLNNQETKYITKSILLKNHIINIYERENHLLQYHNLLSQNEIINNSNVWDEAIHLIYRTLFVLNRLQETPSLIEKINGKIKKSVVLEYYNKALRAQKSLKSITKQVTIHSIIPLNEYSDLQRSFYAIGTVEKDGLINKYLARISLSRKEHGLYFEDIQEINNIQTQDRILTQLDKIVL